MTRMTSRIRRIPLTAMLCLLMILGAAPVAGQTPGGTAPWFVEGDVSCGRIALVFNIGIGETPSASILQTLIDQDVAATMFPMGSFAREQPEYLRLLNDAGFEIGTHGDQNLFLTGASTDEVRQDIRASVAAIESVIGRQIEPYHTPYAADTDLRVRAVVAEEGLLPVGWKVAAPDWGPDATEEGVYRRIMDSVYPGAIVEMHLDGPATEVSTARALPRLIEDLRAKGYEFVTIGEMLESCDATSVEFPDPVTIANMGVHGLHCRTAPSTASTLIRILMDGEVVPVRGPAFDGWVPVECAGQNGWILAEYVPELVLTG
jgi:peptidoglycan/xylan/chitin deacetylase (PgdA/CDA1 family)